MRLTQAAACVGASIALSATNASVVVHDNTNGQFVLGAMLNLFDPSLAPTSQAAAVPERSITYFGGFGGGSGTPQGDGIGCGEALRVPLNPVPFQIRVPPINNLFEFFLTQTFANGEPVGPDEDYANGGTMALFRTGFRTPLVGLTPFTGFRLQLADGVHFGWIQWLWSSGPFFDGGTILMYQPIRWAYETEPNVPIVVPAPTAIGLLALAGLVASRRQRRA